MWGLNGGGDGTFLRWTISAKKYKKGSVCCVMSFCVGFEWVEYLLYFKFFLASYSLINHANRIFSQLSPSPSPPSHPTHPPPHRTNLENNKNYYHCLGLSHGY